MEGVLAGVFPMPLSRKSDKSETKSLIEELEAVKLGMEAASDRFEYQSDPDLVEACIYEMKALSARYRYLTREARRLGITREAVLSLKQL